MLGFSYHGIMQVSAFREEGEKKPDQICVEGVIFGMQVRWGGGGNYAKTILPFDNSERSQG